MNRPDQLPQPTRVESAPGAREIAEKVREIVTLRERGMVYAKSLAESASLITAFADRIAAERVMEEKDRLREALEKAASGINAAITLFDAYQTTGAPHQFVGDISVEKVRKVLVDAKTTTSLPTSDTESL